MNEHPHKDKDRMRFGRAASVCFRVLLTLSMALSAGSESLWANGNVSADETPPPVRKSVQKAPIKKARPAAKKTKKKVKAAPSKTGKKPSRPRLSSLQQGMALMRQERYEAAYPWLQKAIQEERRNPEAWYWYGMYHEKTAQFEQAQFFYRKAMELDPGFEPFSRVVVYPGDGERVPLWDPKRPARVYPIPTNDHGMAIIPPDSPQARRRPVRPPIDPELPKVPVYTPPEPGAGPFDGDAWQPSVYVPPGRERLIEGGEAVYTPPETRIVPLAPPPPIGIGALPASPSPVAPAAPPHSESAPVYQPPLPQAQATGQGGGDAALGAPSSPPTPAPQAASGVPVYQPPLPGNSGGGNGAVSGDQPVYQPPVPSTASGDQPVYQPPVPEAVKK